MLEGLAEIGLQELRIDENLVVGGDLDANIAEAVAVELQRHLDLDGAPRRIELDRGLRRPATAGATRPVTRRRQCRRGPKTCRGNPHRLRTTLFIDESGQKRLMIQTRLMRTAPPGTSATYFAVTALYSMEALILPAPAGRRLQQMRRVLPGWTTP